MKFLRPSRHVAPFVLSILCSALAVSAPCEAAGELVSPQAEHVVLVVWDGMRPDFIKADTTPTLFALAKSGTFFANNHAVYVTSTEVNGATIATGCYPGTNGIVANREYRPEVSLVAPYATEGTHAARIMDALRGNHYLRVPTIAERVQQAGDRTAVASTKPVAFLHDRLPDRSATHGSTIIFAGKSNPPGLAKVLEKALGDFPDYPPAGTLAPNTAQNVWTTRALVEEMWKDGVPRFTTLWLGDPDYSQHLTQPGSPTALAGIRGSDDNLATVLAALDAKGVRSKTDVFVVSDHGFSTVNRGVSLSSIFKKAGFTTVREYKQVPKPGEVLIVPLGGTVQLYVPQHDKALIQRLVTFLQGSDFSGPIFTREAVPGTFALRDVKIESPDSPDVVFSFRWTTDKNRAGAPGSFVSEVSKAGFGTHASLSPFDIHNTLVAAGPHIRAGFVDQLPTGNVDVAPTILHLLGIQPKETLDGRVIAEAMAGASEESPATQPTILEAKASDGGREWRAYLKFTQLGEHIYLDEGNIGAPPAH